MKNRRECDNTDIKLFFFCKRGRVFRYNCYWTMNYEPRRNCTLEAIHISIFLVVDFNKISNKSSTQIQMKQIYPLPNTKLDILYKKLNFGYLKKFLFKKNY